MTAALYWKERLEAGCPLYCEAHHNNNWRRVRPDDPGMWFRAVARQALFMDYCEWFEREYRPRVLRAPEGHYFAELEPQPMSEAAFFAAMAPWLYVEGKKQQVRAYVVDVDKWLPERAEWVGCRQRRYFVRLAPHSVHAEAFFRSTGIMVPGLPSVST